MLHDVVDDDGNVDEMTKMTQVDGVSHIRKSPSVTLASSSTAAISNQNDALNESAIMDSSERELTPTEVDEMNLSSKGSASAINISSIYRHDQSQHDALLQKLTWRLLPFLFILYTFSFLDRSNLSNVHKSMVADIDLSETEYGSATSIFFIPYVILEIPSNMILERVDARRWLARIIFTWGCISTLMLAIQGYSGLVIARFLLGVAESGFFPGIIFYLTQWFTPAERAQRLAFIFVAQPISGILGGILAYPILTYLDGAWGMAGWRWVFLLEGLPTIVLGVITWFYLPANPMEAEWLTLEERQFLTQRTKGASAHGHHSADVNESTAINVESQINSSSSSINSSGDRRYSRSNSDIVTESTPAFQQFQSRSIVDDTDDLDEEAQQLEEFEGTVRNDGPIGVTTIRMRLIIAWRTAKIECAKLYRSTFSNRIIYLCIITNFLILMPVQAITFYLPSIVTELGVSSLTGNLISAIPYSCAAVTMFLVSSYSDRSGERARPIIACNILGFVSLACTAASLSYGEGTPSTSIICMQLLFLSLTAVGVWSCKPALMALFTTNLVGNIAVAIAAVTTVGNLSGIIAPLVMSSLRANSGNYGSGCFFLMTCLLIASWTVAGLNREIEKAKQNTIARTKESAYAETQQFTNAKSASQLQLQTHPHPSDISLEDEIEENGHHHPEPSRNRNKLK